MRPLSKIRIILFGFILFTLLFCPLVEAKSKTTLKAEPVIYDGIKYTTSLDNVDDVEAWDISSGKMIWGQSVYNPEDVDIIKLTIKEGKLIVENEKGKKYELGLVTRVEQFSFNGFDFRLGTTEKEIIRNLGSPQKIRKEKIKNIYDHNQMDETIEIYYDGLYIKIYNVKAVDGDKEMIEAISVFSNKYKIKWGLNIGCSRQQVKDILGAPSEVDNEKLTYSLDGNFPHQFDFFIKDGKVYKIEWSYYMD